MYSVIFKFRVCIALDVGVMGWMVHNVQKLCCFLPTSQYR